jgi:hypothetical protein
MGRGNCTFDWMTLLAAAFMHRALNNVDARDTKLGKAFFEPMEPAHQNTRYTLLPQHRETLREAIRGTPLEKELTAAFLQSAGEQAPLCEVCGNHATVNPCREWGVRDLPDRFVSCDACREDLSKTACGLDWESKLVAVSLSQHQGVDLNDGSDSTRYGRKFFALLTGGGRQRGVLDPAYANALPVAVARSPRAAELVQMFMASASPVKSVPTPQPAQKPEPTADELADAQLMDARKKREAKEELRKVIVANDHKIAALQNGYDITHRATEELDRPMRPRYPHVAPLMTGDMGNPWRR